MKKITLSLLLIILSTIFVSAQWQKLDLTKAAGGSIPGVVNYMTIDNNKLYVATSDGIWESASKNGGDWVSFGLQGMNVKLLSFATLKLATISVTASDNAIYFTNQLYKLDNNNWIKTNFNPLVLNNYTATINFTQIQNGNQTVILVPTWRSGIWRSTDNGETFTQYAIETTTDGDIYKNVIGLYTFPGDNNIYGTDKVSGSMNNLIYSEDFGVTWKWKNVGNFYNPYTFFKRNFGGISYYYYGGQNGNYGSLCYRSDDKGDSWSGTFTTGAEYWENRRFVGDDDGSLYVMCSINNVYVSTDNGDTFKAVGTGLVIPTQVANDKLYLTHMIKSSEKLYVSTESDGIWFFALTNSAVNSVSDFQFSLSPIPTQDILNISNIETGSKISVWSITGKIIKSFISENSKIQLNVKELNPSIYVIKVISPDGKQSVNRFVKK